MIHLARVSGQFEPGVSLMNFNLFAACGVAAVCAASPAIAQIAPAAPIAAAPIAAPVTTNAILRTGTEVPLRLSEELTTKGKKLRVGQRFHMEVAEAVKVQGITVIPVGAPAVG